MSPKKRFGQHFLYQPFYFKTITQAIHILPNEQILEIGTGPARLTEYLLKSGALLWGIEIDKELEAPLIKLKSQYPSFSYTIQDFLSLTTEQLSKVNKIVGNLPYHLTIPILEKVIFDTKASRIVFLLAEATALRFMAEPGSKHYSSASVMVQSFFTIQKVLFIDRKSFFPPPKVDSILIQLDRKKTDRKITPNELHFYKLLFSGRRKTLINSLSNITDSKEKWNQWLSELTLNPLERIENIAVGDLHKIYVKAENNGIF